MAIVEPVVQISGRVGIEIELLAPKRASRQTLADAIARTAASTFSLSIAKF